MRRSISLSLSLRCSHSLSAAKPCCCTHPPLQNDKGRMMTEEELDTLLDRSKMMADDEIKQEAKVRP
jgi:hypothetical protein